MDNKTPLDILDDSITADQPSEEAAEKRPLYEIIDDAITADYCLPEGFSLPGSAGPGAISFADGAQDGIWIFHMMHEEPSAEQLSLIADAVWAVSLADYGKADQLFLKLSAQIQPLAYMDALQDFIIDNQKTLPKEPVIEYSVRCMTGASEKDLVKVGLILAELFDIEKDDSLAAVIRTLALSDEFTIFCLYQMKSWKDGNLELFSLAKRVRGWGRIHCINFLEPENDVIREWLLTEGVHNDVLPAYSALDCWEKSGAANRLKGLPAAEDSSMDGPVSAKEIKGICGILEALFDEGPVPGISAVEKAGEALRNFLMAIRRYKLGPDEYGLLSRIKEYFQDPAHKDDFSASICDSIISGI